MHSFRPIYYFNRVYGFLPFTIIYNSRGTVHGHAVETHDILWLGISITINLMLAFLISKDTEFLQDSKDGSIILVGGDYLAHIFTMIFDTILIGTDLCIRYKLVNVLKKINNFDEKVSQFFYIFICSNYLNLPFFRLQQLGFISIIQKSIAVAGNIASCYI